MPPLDFDATYQFLEEKYRQYNRLDFIENDPICIPHRFAKKQDIEIAGFIAATLAWGQRITIINKSNALLALMDDAPHDFIVNHSKDDLKKFLHFKHRTFNSTDCLYFIAALQSIYTSYDSMEEVFAKALVSKQEDIKPGIINFHNEFFSLPDFPIRTKKHVATPSRNSACKRINMYLRWMVRKDDSGVDFGIWQKIRTHQLICPCDVHVDKVARKLGLIKRKQTDWQTAKELTDNLKLFDPIDPVKYDFALFGLGVEAYFDL